MAVRIDFILKIRIVHSAALVRRFKLLCSWLVGGLDGVRVSLVQRFQLLHASGISLTQMLDRTVFLRTHSILVYFYFKVWSPVHR